MNNLERVSEMKSRGLTDNSIMNTLKSEGFSQKEIESLISQADIRQAVDETEDIKAPQDLNQSELKKENMAEEYEGMQPSMLNTGQENNPSTQEYPPQQYNQPITQEYASQPYPASQQNYEQYSYSSGISADTISEISEQVVSEKLSSIKDQLEKTMDLKNNLDSKIAGIDERLKRMEKIIDRLQLSILQKVGEYVTNVADIKTELEETQKTFKALVHSPKHNEHRK